MREKNVKSGTTAAGIPLEPRTSGILSVALGLYQDMSIVAKNPILELSSNTFNQEVVANRSPILIDFWAPWCGPCRMMKPILAQAAEALAGDVRVATINVDDEPAIADAFGIRSIPTLVLVADGKVIDSVNGIVPASGLVTKIRAKLSATKVADGG